MTGEAVEADVELSSRGDDSTFAVLVLLLVLLLALLLGAGGAMLLIPAVFDASAKVDAAVGTAGAIVTPRAQLSQIFCFTVAEICGRSSLLLRWSEQTRAPHLRQWCLRRQSVKAF